MTSYRVELAPLPCTVHLNGLSKVKIGSEGEKEVMIKKEGTQQDRQSVPFFSFDANLFPFWLGKGKHGWPVESLLAWPDRLIHTELGLYWVNS
jgi:hypothetical protein